LTQSGAGPAGERPASIDPAGSGNGVRAGGEALAGGGEAPPRRPRDWWREQRRLPRRRLLVVGAVVLVVFVAFSVLLASYLSTENVERTDVLDLLRAQAAGDAGSMIARLSGCSTHPGCVAQARQNAAALRRPGSVKILTLHSQTAYAVTSATGTTRVAWTTIGRLPTVQCMTVSRSGNLLTGLSVTLRSLSRPIPGEADC
jgi:hypothetical protein